MEERCRHRRRHGAARSAVEADRDRRRRPWRRDPRSAPSTVGSTSTSSSCGACRRAPAPGCASSAPTSASPSWRAPPKIPTRRSRRRTRPGGIEVLAGFPMHEKLAAELSAFELKTAPAGAWPSERARPATLVVTRTVSGDEKTLAPAMEARGSRPRSSRATASTRCSISRNSSIAPLDIFAFMRAIGSPRMSQSARPFCRARRRSTASCPTAPRRASGATASSRRRCAASRARAGCSFRSRRASCRQAARIRTWLVLLTGRAVRQHRGFQPRSGCGPYSASSR